MLNKDVVFLRNERAWKQWAGKWGDVLACGPPTQYPCWVYRRVSSFRDEEEAPEYLYRSDLVQMLAKIDGQKG